MALKAFMSVCAAATLMSCGLLAQAQSSGSGAPNENRSPYQFDNCMGGPTIDQVDLSQIPIRQGKAVMLYEQHFGLYPRVWYPHDGRPYEIHNGGIPARVDWNAHVTKMKRDIAVAIPDPNWDGYAIIDWESWFPVWSLMNDVVKDLSRAKIRERYPNMRAEEVERRAEREFEQTATDFLVRTVQVCKEERPNAKWGFYGHPYPEFDNHRAKLQPIFDVVDAFYPMVYALNYSVPDGSSTANGQRHEVMFRRQIDQKIALTRNVAAGRPVIALMWMRYHDMNPVYRFQMINNIDLRMMVRQPYVAGADGALFWDYINTNSLAATYNEYMNTNVNPVLRALIDEIVPPTTPPAAPPAPPAAPPAAPPSGPAQGTQTPPPPPGSQPPPPGSTNAWNSPPANTGTQTPPPPPPATTTPNDGRGTGTTTPPPPPPPAATTPPPPPPATEQGGPPNQGRPRISTTRNGPGYTKPPQTQPPPPPPPPSKP